MILCVNSKPAINDITIAELIVVMKNACKLNRILDHAYNVSKSLIISETGSASPCLDLSRINSDLVDLIIKNNVDLVLLEGMGRSIHTNYHARFSCDCLKIAIIKNQWLAERFGLTTENKNNEKKFPIVFKYENADEK